MFPSNFPYIFLIVSSLLMEMISAKWKFRSNYTVKMFFLLLFLVLAFRSVNIGIDLEGYRNKFEMLSQTTWKDVGLIVREVGYGYFNKICQLFTANFQCFLAVVAAVVLIPICCLYKADIQNNYLKIILFMNMATFQMMFSGLRQTIAIGLGVVAYFFVKKKQWWWFLLIVFVAYQIHHSAIILLLLYPIVHAKITYKWLVVIVPLFVLLFIFKSQIAALALLAMRGSEELSIYYERYSDFGDTGAYGSLILFALFTCLAYIVVDEKRMSKDAMGLRNIMLLASFMQMVALINPVLMRINYYFIIFLPVALAESLQYVKPYLKNEVAIIKIVICVYMTIHYINVAYTGVDILQLYPYEPFWDDEI